MSAKFFSLMATDDCPSFEPVSCWQGAWSGVAKVELESEQERLLKRGCREITEDEYVATVKKKAQQQSQFPAYREVPQTLGDVRPAARSPQAPVDQHAPGLETPFLQKQEAQPIAVTAETSAPPVAGPVPARRQASTVVPGKPSAK